MISDQFITARKRTINQALLIITIFCMVTMIVGLYTKGENLQQIPGRIFAILSYYAYGLLISNISFYLMRFSKQRILTYLPLFIMSNPLMDAASFIWVERVMNAEVLYNWILPVSVVLEVATLVYLFFVVRKYPQAFSLARVENLERTEAPSNKPDKLDKIIFQLNNALGQGDTGLDRIIRSLIQRADASRRNILFTIIAIAGIVTVGISFSVGMTAYSEIKKVRELEKTRLELIAITKEITNSDPAKFPELKKDIQKIISQKYGDEKSYQQTIQNIEKQTVVSWPDIAMRVTIAALTLFLVQVFFNIYKYNQQQLANLLTRAETLELYRETGADQEALRTGLLAKLDTNPSFDKTPVSPTEQIINVFSKTKENKFRSATKQ